MKKKIKKILSYSIMDGYEILRDRKIERRKKTKKKKIIKRYFLDQEIRRLHIGCGSNILEGWLNTDIKDDHEKIAYLDAGENFPFHDEEFEYIYSEHLFEHLNVDQQMNMLKECHRVLKKDGVLRIATPSLDFLIDIYSDAYKKENQEYLRWAVDNIPNLRSVRKFSSSNYNAYVINNFFRDWGHQLIHNSKSLKELAVFHGFKRIVELKIGESSFADLCKIEKHGTIIPEQANELETMVLEIYK